MNNNLEKFVLSCFHQYFVLVVYSFCILQSMTMLIRESLITGAYISVSHQ